MDAADGTSPRSEPRRLGDFVLRERIAEGGQGELYRAEQPMLGRDAVVKILRLPERNVEELRARFLREAHIASHLDHPYAAHVYAFGAEGDTLWIAMEYVRGTSMAELLASAGPMPLARLVPVFGRLAQVVHSAHEQGIVHRDIKPANVMIVSRAGRLLPKLLDLGIARLTDAPLLEQVGEVTDMSTAAAAAAAPLNVTGQRESHIGTPQYMAPEQWVDPRQADARTDVYALGVLCHEMLTGRRPFDGATLMEVARAHARKPVPPLGEGFPAELDTVRKVAAVIKTVADEAAQDPRAKEMAKIKEEIEGLGKKEELTEAEQARLDKLTERRDALEQQDDNSDTGSSNNAQTLDEMEARVKRHPAAVRALAREGLTAREYAKATMALLFASMVEGFSQGKADLTKLPPGVNPENVRFVRENKAELDVIYAAMSGKNKK